MDFSAFDDLTIVSGKVQAGAPVTLLTIVHNEMYFLPAFLAHYRNLGIEQFVVLDDASTDGTRTYLAQQPDVVVVKSAYRYGDRVTLAGPKPKDVRILYIWRSLLHERFALDRWALQVDADEFIHLPPGRDFREIGEGLNDVAFDVIWTVMLDVYPRDFGSLSSISRQETFDPETGWYFDAEPHVRLRKGRWPTWIHTGARARLYESHGLRPLMEELGIEPDRKWLRRFWHQRVLKRPQPYNAIWKPSLSRWRKGARYNSSHRNSLAASTRHLLPMVHYRFSGPVFGKIDAALAEQSYSNASRDHRLLKALIEKMAASDAPFVYRRSRALEGYGGFQASGNAKGFKA